MEELQGRKLNAEEEKNFWRTYENSKVEISDMKSYELYNNFIREQQPGFVSVLYKLNEIMERLKLEGKISEYAKWSARIKHFENVMKAENMVSDDNSEKKNKALDDIFGVRIIGASEKELSIIEQELEKNFAVGDKKKESSNLLYNLTKISEILKDCTREIGQKSRKSKVYSILGEVFDTINGGVEKAKEQLESIYEKENIRKTSRERGYDAKHRYYYVKDQHESPMIEFQFWTVELDYKCTFGDLSYSSYKDISKKEIQKKYEKNEFKIGNNIPIIYEGADSNGRIEALSSTEALKKVYPFLNMNQTKGNEK